MKAHAGSLGKIFNGQVIRVGYGKVVSFFFFFFVLQKFSFFNPFNSQIPIHKLILNIKKDLFLVEIYGLVI